MKQSLLLLSSALVAVSACGAQTVPASGDAGSEVGAGAAADDDFIAIFDGESLAGWEGDPTYWRVEDGAIVGEITPETVVQRNTFLIWRGGTVADFELVAEFRVSEQGNSGISYRNAEVPDLQYALTGYQADLDGRKRYTGSNYEERGRTTLAAKGQRVVVQPVPAGEDMSSYVARNAWQLTTVVEDLGTAEELDANVRDGDWNEYRIVARGNVMQHYVNGVLMSEVVDEDPVNRRMSGLLGVQVHTGPPMKVEYRNIRLKHL
ncbi:MAG TPA: DUF1080 domain-containing protein [Longimicrobiales bacterium]|nr:DUF1080 domain-containing protein [Longimicrobiales bacterium]